MPELPEIEALATFLDERTSGLSVTRAELGAIAALKTFDPPLESTIGLIVQRVTRRGKHLCLSLGDEWLVLHLARGGWVRWSKRLPSGKLRPGRSPLALRLGFSDDSGIDVTEMGTEKRLGIWIVRDLEQLDGIATLGPDPLSPEFDADRLGSLLAGETSTIKNALTNQRLIAGIGNAYSDEILNAARLSPFKQSSKLNADEVARLFVAVTDTLRQAVERNRDLPPEALKDDKRRAMRVHGRTGEACPACGDTVREVSFATKSLQYCPTCQTGGKPLADRRLSRLIK